jgi:hypothetical protein
MIEISKHIQRVHTDNLVVEIMHTDSLVVEITPKEV